ncbi:MAG: hypothetical protein GX107_02535, partial [Clostridiales bacterium]|nr:hypothetical protein [Clostridiales bacterium]
MKTAKRILAVVLSVVMAFSVFSIAVSAEPIGDPALGTAIFELNFYKITTDGGGNETRTLLPKSGAALSTGDIVEVGYSVETNFWTGSVYAQFWYDKTVFLPLINGVADGVTKQQNIFTGGFAQLIDYADAPTAFDVEGNEWNLLDTLGSPGGYTGLVNNNHLVQPQFPHAWHDGPLILPGYENMNFVSIIFACNTTSSADGYLINIPKAEYATFRLTVVADASTTTSSTIEMPYAGVYTTMGQTSNKIYCSSYAAGYTRGQTSVSPGRCIDLDNATGTFEINSQSSTFSAKFFEQDGTTEITSLAIDDIESGDFITLPNAPVIEGYDFDYWTVGAQTYNAGSQYEVTENVEFAAHYTAKTQYTVTFVSNNTAYGTITGTPSVSVYSGTPWNDDWYPTYSAASGYKFNGWTGAVPTVTGNVTVTANFVQDNSQWATISFASGSNGTIDTLAPQTVLKGTPWSAITVPATHPSANYVFDKWTPALPSASDTITADATYTASFKSTLASYNIEVYRMNTSGAYGTPETSTETGTIGTTVSVNPASYVTPGFTVNAANTVSSSILAESGTVLKVYLDRITVYYTYKYYDYAADNGTYIQFQQDDYLYGQTVTLPATVPDASLYGKAFNSWHVGSVGGATFTGGTANANTDIYAAFDDINTELDYSPITDAISELPTNMNLYYYTDEAIIMVAAALNQTINEAGIDAFLAATYAYKDMTTSFTTQAQLQAAADNITAVNETINIWVGDGGVTVHNHMPYRDESKAIVKFAVVPDKTTVNPGDLVTFTVKAYTSFLCPGMMMGVVWDSDMFDLVNIYDEVFAKEDLLSPDLFEEEVITVTASTAIKRHYDIECWGVTSPVALYPTIPAGYNTPEYMDRYKIILGTVITKAAPNSVVSQFGSSPTSMSDLFEVTLKAKDSVDYDGTQVTTGFVEEWFPTILPMIVNPISVIRAGHDKQFGIPDNAAQFGQTFSTDNAVVTFGQEGCDHEWSDWTPDDGAMTHSRECALCGATETSDCTFNAGVITTPATCTENGVKTFTCSVCGRTYTESVPSTGHDWGGWGYDGEEAKTHTRVCANDDSHTQTEACSFGEGAVVTVATCTTDGVMKYTCSVCGGTYTETIPATGHDWGDWEYDGEEAKTHTRVCANDDSHTETEACLFGDGVVTTPA